MRKKIIKKLVKDNTAIAEVLGSILILVIMLPIVTLFGLTFTDMMNEQRNMLDSQIDAMYRFTDYLNSLAFKASGTSWNKTEDYRDIIIKWDDNKKGFTLHDELILTWNTTTETWVPPVDETETETWIPPVGR